MGINKVIIAFFAIVAMAVSSCTAQPGDVRNPIFGSAYLENAGYDFLGRMCDMAGGRLPGSPNNKRAVEMLTAELTKFGYSAEIETFQMPGWVRENDEIVVMAPYYRKLRACALGYVNKTFPLEGTIYYAGHGYEEDYDKDNLDGRFVLIEQGGAKGRRRILRYEQIEIAARKGAYGILFINNKEGGLLQAGVTNFDGEPSAIPAYSITYEEGMWLKRLAERGETVSLKMWNRSYTTKEPIESQNVVCRLPGRSDKKIVIGAHIDSWDLGQGAGDNGHGTAILLDVARLLKKYAPENEYTLEFVWFNAEELGLWGSKAYAARHADEVAAMINMDMTSSPSGINLMGFKEYEEFFENIISEWSGYDMNKGVFNHPWPNSDHMYFMFEGIPSFTLTGELEEGLIENYHAFGDTFDKVNVRFLSDAAAVVSLLAYNLANPGEFVHPKYSRDQLREMMIEHGMDERLKEQKQWPFGE
ncbi:MAG: M28 family peptidase [Bacteroidota bacterium]